MKGLGSFISFSILIIRVYSITSRYGQNSPLPETKNIEVTSPSENFQPPEPNDDGGRPWDIFLGAFTSRFFKTVSNLSP